MSHDVSPKGAFVVPNKTRVLWCLVFRRRRERESVWAGCRKKASHSRFDEWDDGYPLGEDPSAFTAKLAFLLTDPLYAARQERPPLERNVERACPTRHGKVLA